MDGIISAYHDPKEGAAPLNYGEMQVSTPWQQFRALLGRNFTMYWRSPEYNLTRFAITILVGLIFGSLFWRQGDNRQTVTGVLNIMGVLFSSVLFMGESGDELFSRPTGLQEGPCFVKFQQRCC